VFWRGPKAIKSELVRYLTRVVTQDTRFRNIGLDVIDVPANAQIIEQFSFEKEFYPRISVAATNNRQIDTGFNNQIGVLREEYPIGSFGTKYENTANGAIQQRLDTEFNDTTIKGIEFDIFGTGGLQENVDIFLGTASGSVVTPIVSGSVLPDDGIGWQHVNAVFNATASITSSLQPYYVVLSSAGTYYLMVDETSDKGGHAVSANPYALGTVVDEDIMLMLVGPQSYRLGGLDEISLTFRCEMMNDQKVSEDLAELTEKYLKLARYAGVNVDWTDKLALLSTVGVQEALGELHSKGIYVATVTTGGEEQRRRGPNDIVYGKTITCIVNSEWGKDFDLEELEDIDLLLHTQT
jgi:hypothetical protein